MNTRFHERSAHSDLLIGGGIIRAQSTMPSGLFQPDFLIALRGMIAVHHSIYAEVPP
jgi:hypothetical protein